MSVKIDGVEKKIPFFRMLMRSPPATIPQRYREDKDFKEFVEEVDQFND